MNWQDWKSGKRPVPADRTVHIEHRNGSISYFKRAGDFTWYWHEDQTAPAAAYDIRRWSEA